jgi:hypothetical protein
MRFSNQSWQPNCGVTRSGHMKTWGRPGLKPEGAIADVAIATQPSKSPIESEIRYLRAENYVKAWLSDSGTQGKHLSSIKRSNHVRLEQPPEIHPRLQFRGQQVQTSHLAMQKQYIHRWRVPEVAVGT